MSTSNDEALLATLGYKQELKRDFSWSQLLGLSFSLIGVVQSIAAVLIYAIPYGGPVAMVWGWAVCSFFLVMIALALAELSSAAPTSGGLYYWTHKYSPPHYRNLLAWTVGYINTVGYMAGVSGSDYATSIIILSAVTIGTNGAYIPTNGHIFGVFCALLAFHALLASLPTRYIARLQPVYLWLNVLLFIGVIIAFPISTPSESKNSAKFVFGTFENLSLWPNGFAFMLSFLAPAWTMGGIDSAVHISEEVQNASVAVPRTMVISTSLGCLLGWACNIAVAFNMGSDMGAILADPIGQPFATILFNSFGQKGTLIIWSFIILTLNMSDMNLLTAASRQMFAFSRDGALPLSSFLYCVNKTTGTPVVTVCTCAFGAMLLGLLSFAGPVTIGAVFTMGIVCQYISFSVPIAARLLGGRSFTKGPFDLGILSIPVACIALVFMAYMIVILMFPTNPAPAASGMNYSVVVVGGVLLLSTVYYFFPTYGGRHWFTGPVTTTGPTVEQVLEDEKYTKQGLSEKSSNEGPIDA